MTFELTGRLHADAGKKPSGLRPYITPSGVELMLVQVEQGKTLADLRFSEKLIGAMRD